MMSTVDRFFEAYDQLSAKGLTKAGFCREIGVDRRNFTKQQADHSRRILKVEWLEAMVLGHGVSADWLLTGRGPIFTE